MMKGYNPITQESIDEYKKVIERAEILFEQHYYHQDESKGIPKQYQVRPSFEGKEVKIFYEVFEDGSVKADSFVIPLLDFIGYSGNRCSDCVYHIQDKYCVHQAIEGVAIDVSEVKSAIHYITNKEATHRSVHKNTPACYYFKPAKKCHQCIHYTIHQDDDWGYCDISDITNASIVDGNKKQCIFFFKEKK